MHDRMLMSGAKPATEIAPGPRPDYAALDLPARFGCAAREARLSVRFGRLNRRPPRENWKTCQEAISMAYMDMREETRPEGEKPLHRRRLLTTREAETVADALDIAAR